MGKVCIEYIIKSCISDKFFEDEDADKKFVEWLQKQIDDEDLYTLRISTDKKFDEFPMIEKLEASLYEDIDYNHDVRLEIEVSTTDDRDTWDYEDFVENDKFVSFLEDQLIPAFIKEFNEQCHVVFPTDDGKFDYIEFRNNNFYAYLYNGSGKGFSSFSVQTTTFQLDDKFEANY